MTHLRIFAPTRWLVCSHDAFTSLGGYWLHEAGGGSLLAMRLSRGWIEFAQPSGLADRIHALTAEGVGHICILFDPVDSSAAMLWDQLSARTDKAITLNLLDWREATLEIVVALNSPDQPLLDALTHVGTGPAPNGASRGHLTIPAWCVELEQGLARWEENARFLQAAEFRETFPRYADRAIAWRDLLVQHESVPTPIGTLPEAANDLNWTTTVLLAAAATSTDDPFAALRRDAPAGSAEKFSLTRAPVLGKKSVYLIFEAHPDCIARYVGCDIKVVAQGVTYDLGKVNADGVSERLVHGSVDLTEAVLRIGRAVPPEPQR